MKTINLEVEDEVFDAYSEFSIERKRKFDQDVALMLKKTIREERSIKMKKLIDELNNEPEHGLNPDILLELFRTDY